MTKITVFKKPKLRNPVLIEGLPGVGNIGRVAAGYMIEELKAKKFAELHSKWFFPFVMLNDDYRLHLVKNEFYYYKAKKGQRDLIILVGDCQSLAPQGHYEVCTEILDFVKSLGCKEIITLGGLATGELEKKPEAIGALSHSEDLKKYKGTGINFSAGERVGYIVGAAGLLLGLGKMKGMRGLCILGETSGFPIVTDPKSAEEVLKSLMKILNIKLNMAKLEERVKEMEKFIKRIETLQSKALMQISKEGRAPSKGGKEQLRYIG